MKSTDNDDPYEFDARLDSFLSWGALICAIISGLGLATIVIVNCLRHA